MLKGRKAKNQKGSKTHAARRRPPAAKIGPRNFLTGARTICPLIHPAKLGRFSSSGQAIF